MVDQQADVHLQFLILQLFIDLYSPLDGKQVHHKLLFQHLISTPIHQDVFQTPLRVVHLTLVTHSLLLFVTTVQLRNAVLSLL